MMTAVMSSACGCAPANARTSVSIRVKISLIGPSACAASVTTEMAKTLDEEFGLREKYGVEQPWHFLVREREAAVEDQFISNLKGVRRRQRRAGKILRKTMGKEVESDRRLWEDSAYLNLVEKIYVRLMEDKSGLPTEELTALSKAMAEHRRVSAREPGATGPEAVKGELPEDFGEAVKQIYGTNFQTTEPRSHEGKHRKQKTRSGVRQ